MSALKRTPVISAVNIAAAKLSIGRSANAPKRRACNRRGDADFIASAR
jgi:hypothetical protein